MRLEGIFTISEKGVTNFYENLHCGSFSPPHRKHWSTHLALP